MKVTLNTVTLLAALAAFVSFSFLVAAISTDFWYLIDASKLEKLSNRTDSLSSHSGLWRTCQFKKTCFPLGNPFKHERTNITSLHKHLMKGSSKVSKGLCFPTDMRGTVVILLPLSLILMIFGGMTGFISILAQAYFLLVFTGLLFLFGALITLAGVSIYITCSAAGFRETIFLLRSKRLQENVSIHFGWSLAFAWLSLAAEVLAGLAFLLMARMIGLKQRQDSTI
ncbi:transmembrane protein 114 isoform X1 [Rhineura floridana]|uniref:transmembrane protein 114 isoform X1 n=1 Tax=Rhineura floridana TaxID=261503 RepID=UPI002AC86BB7|nr:transmembrane protein 114 isoform X1 [Rhineura floridana]